MSAHPPSNRFFPRFNEISPRFFGMSEEMIDFIRGIDRIDSKCVDVWDKMATRNNCAILEEIFDKLVTTHDCHSGASWRFLCAYFQNIARTGFPDRFLLKNQHLWVRNFYLPDYLPGVLFIAGASLIVALRDC